MRVIKWIYEYARDQLFRNFHSKHCHYVKDNEVVSINWFNKYSNSPDIHIYDTSDTDLLLLLCVLITLYALFPCCWMSIPLSRRPRLFPVDRGMTILSYLYNSGSFPKFKSVNCRERSLSCKFFLMILESGKRIKFSIIAINNFKVTYFPTQ